MGPLERTWVLLACILMLLGLCMVMISRYDGYGQFLADDK